MKSEILNKLSEIQANDEIRIISAREMGSRLLGAEHENSDWDIMFIYCFDEPWKYPAIGYSRETMEIKDEPLDLHGWNIDKFASHLQDSNPMAMEFLAASAYREESPGLWRDIEEDAKMNFNHMALYHHYISLAKSNYTKYIENGNDRTLGRHFYIARALACASHIRQAKEFPPMDADTLIEDGEMNDPLRQRLRRFTEAKRNGNGDEKCDDRIGNLYKAESEAPMSPTEDRTHSPDPALTNELLRQTLE